VRSWRRPLRRRTARPRGGSTRRTGTTASEQLAHRVADLWRLDAVRQLDRLDDPPELRQRSSLDGQVGQELVENLGRRLGAGVRRQQRHQLVALTGLTPSALGSLLETRILAHLRWAARTARTTRARATVAEWRAWTTGTPRPAEWRARATIAEWRAWATGAAWPIAKRRTRAARATELRTRARHAWHRRRQALKGCPVSATIWPSEALTARSATAPIRAAALAATTATTARATWSTAPAAARPDRHVAAPTVVVVHATTVHALASATALTVVL
jgi:hypothetical protein